MKLTPRPPFKEIVILLTATINPEGTENTVLQNSLIRKRQYLNALNFYLENTDVKIVFCENTGHDISHDLTNPHKYKRLETLTFNGNDYDKRKGKGYGEAIIINHAIENSSLINDDTFLIKITGRVKILNIKGIIYKIRHLKNTSLVAEGWKPGWIESVCFGCPTNWLKNTISIYGNKLDDNEYKFQNMLYEAITSTNKITFKSIYPLIDGISGKTGLPYINNSLYQRKLDNFNFLNSVYKRNGAFLLGYLAWLRWIFYRLLIKFSSLSIF